MMNIGIILYYAIFELTKSGNKTPKYESAAEWGGYPPMQALRGKNGQVSLYLMERQEGGKPNAPRLRLQAKDSLNLTGLKSTEKYGYYYGYPMIEPTFSKKKKPNPFYPTHISDGFLFVFHSDDTKTMTPTMFEMIVIEGANRTVPDLYKQLIFGAFDPQLTYIKKCLNLAI